MTARPAMGIVAGSGLALDGVLDEVREMRPFGASPALGDPAVEGHAGAFLMGGCCGIPVVLQQGRLHFYEGFGYAAATKPVDVMRDMGVERIVFTNAAGGLEPAMVPGSLMAVSSVGLWPCRMWPDQPRELELDWVIPGCDTTGRYAWVHGPSYETRAEIGALQRSGGAAVGMSTAPELVRCGELGISAAAISCITNNCCVPRKLTHEHVIKIAATASDRLTELLRTAFRALAGGDGA